MPLDLSQFDLQWHPMPQLWSATRLPWSLSHTTFGLGHTQEEAIQALLDLETKELPK